MAGSESGNRPKAEEIASFSSELGEALEELQSAVWEASQEVDPDELFDALCDPLGLVVDSFLTAEDISDKIDVLLSHLIFHQPLESALSRSLRERVDELVESPLARELRAIFAREPLRLLRVEQMPLFDVFDASPVAGPQPRRARPVHLLFARSIDDIFGEPASLGWLFELRGFSIFMSIAPFSRTELNAFLRHTAPGRDETEAAFWERQAPALVRRKVDPHDAYSVGTVRAYAESREYWLQHSVRSATYAVRRDLRWAGYRGLEVSSNGQRVSVSWFRELLAEATDPAEMAGIRDMVTILVEAAAARAVEWWSYRRGLEAGDIIPLVSVDAILDAFGVREDGSLAGVDPEALLRRPTSLLLLPDDCPLFADVHPSSPIRVAVDWAQARPADPAAAEVLAAHRYYLVESRWLATDRPATGRQPLDVPGWRAYEEALHALAAIFDPAAIEASLSGLDLGRGGLKRLVGALAERRRGAPERSEDWTIGDLPPRSETLFDLPRVGRGTVERLAESLVDYAVNWRFRAVGLDRKQLDRQVAEGDGQDELRDGLDELAAIFE